MESNQCRRFYLITYPRTGSNLLLRILALEDQPNVLPREMGGYFFMPSFLLSLQLKCRGQHLEKWTQDEKHQMMQSYQACFEELESHLKIAEEQNKMVFIKEHCDFLIEPTAQTNILYRPRSDRESPWTVRMHDRSDGEAEEHSSLNKTFLPDRFLMKWLPTFLIRHPALAFPSQYRALKDSEGSLASGDIKLEENQLELSMTLHFTRSLYNWYTVQLAEVNRNCEDDVTWPLILDADDVMTEPDMIALFCEIVGLDANRLKFSWAQATDEDLAELPNDASRRFLDTLSSSTKIMAGKTSAKLDIDVEAKKWREEFGKKDGKKMERWVRAAMRDYEFMKAKRLKPKCYEMYGWTVKHDDLLQELIYLPRPGGLNQENISGSWREIEERFCSLSPSRGLGERSIPWHKLATRYYNYIKPRSEGLMGDLAPKPAPPGESSQMDGEAEETSSNNREKTMENREESRDGSKNAVNTVTGKEELSDIMDVAMNEA